MTMPIPGTAQIVTVTAPDCRACSISKTVVAEFGADAKAKEAAPSGLLGAISLGREYLGLPLRAGGVPILFSAFGRVARLLGRSGQGPGEFVMPIFAVKWLGDSVVIADPVASRFSVFSSDLHYGRSIVAPITGLESLVTVGAGDFVASGGINTRGSVGFPIHRFDRNGVLVRSFGSAKPTVRPDQAFQQARLLATDGRRVWSAVPQGEYLVEQWDPATGGRTMAIQRRATFFPAGQQLLPPTPSRPPPAAVTGMFYDGGLLWVLVVVPGSRWADGLSKVPAAGEGGEAHYTIEDLDQVFDTVVDVFDPGTGRLITSKRFPEYMTALLSQAALAVSHSEEPDGSIVTRLASFRLVRP